MEDYDLIYDDFFHLARVALSERTQDVHLLLHRIVKRKSTDPKLVEELVGLLRERPTQSTPLRRETEMAVPVDSDSRFQLLRVEVEPNLPNEPVYPEMVQQTLDRLVAERLRISALLNAHLEPTRTVLFTGPPGVGKTLAARWLAREMNRPLLILDLSAVMSSYLGRTGANLRHVLEYAKSIDCVLLLDELDAIAKRRDDFGEIGELKRLVTVLLQQLDDWPSTGILISATNHSKLLDPAVWRRFEQRIEFPLPEQNEVRVFIADLLRYDALNMENWSDVLSISLSHQSFSDIEHKLNLARREAVLNGKDLIEYLPSLLCVEGKSKNQRMELAVKIVAAGLASQRKAQELTGVARETIRKRMKPQETIEKGVVGDGT